MITGKWHGIARYTEKLIRHLAEIDTDNSYFLLGREAPLAEVLAGTKKAGGAGKFRIIPCRTPLYSLREQVAIPRLLKREGFDLFHATSYSAPVRCPTKLVMTIHDLIHLAHPGKKAWIYRLYYRLFVRRAAHRAKRVITVSRFSRDDIVERLGVGKSKISVTYEGSRFEAELLGGSTGRGVETGGAISEREAPTESFSNGRRKKAFLLNMGNEKPHKNVISVVKAYSLLRDRGFRTLELLLIGRQSGEVLRFLRDNNLTGSVTLKEQAPDDELARLLREARIFIFPSLYEGFGLPVLEAMSLGTPVVISDRASLPEVAGDAGVYVDPLSVGAIAEALERILTQPGLEKDLAERCRTRAREFSWRRMAEETLEIYRQVIEAV
jgi:glycosyltransferase involved in cell wall biosynthesis